MEDLLDEIGRDGIKGCALRFLILVVAIGVTVILCLLFSSCRSVQSQTEYRERLVEVRVRDTIITAEADSASLRALLHCDSAYNVVVGELSSMQGQRIHADVSTKTVAQKGLELSFNCKEDSLQIVCHMKDSIITDLRKQVQVLSVPRTRSGYDKFCSAFFWIVLIILLTVVAFKICDKVPATKPYTTAIKMFFKIF